jgi:cytochrome c553
MLKKIIILVFIVLVIIQFFRPDKNISSKTPNTDFLVSTQAPETIAAMINTSCYDCHSNNTNYPWYAEVAPISWMIANHVEEGKEELNFSEWSTFSEKRKKKKIKEMIDELEEKEMPLAGYLLMHSEAKLSEAQTEELLTWIKSQKK